MVCYTDIRECDPASGSIRTENTITIGLEERSMKELYQEAEMSVVDFAPVDVITTSMDIKDFPPAWLPEPGDEGAPDYSHWD